MLDVKNVFHMALKEAAIDNFTWHDFRHDYASRLVMAGVSLRAVAEVLGHHGLRMVMRYAHLSPGFLSDEVRDSTRSAWPPKAQKGQEKGNPHRTSAERSESRENPHVVSQDAGDTSGLAFAMSRSNGVCPPSAPCGRW